MLAKLTTKNQITIGNAPHKKERIWTMKHPSQNAVCVVRNLHARG